MFRSIPLVRQLRKYNEMINKEIRYLNCGGCGVFASRMGKAIAPYVSDLECLVLSFSTFSSDKGINLNTIKQKNNDLNSIRDWSTNGVDFNHVILRFKYRNRVWYYDSEHLSTDPKNAMAINHRILDGELTLDEITKLANNPEGWNPAFDRESYIPVIDKTIPKYIH